MLIILSTSLSFITFKKFHWNLFHFPWFYLFLDPFLSISKSTDACILKVLGYYKTCLNFLTHSLISWNNLKKFITFTNVLYRTFWLISVSLALDSQLFHQLLLRYVCWWNFLFHQIYLWIISLQNLLYTTMYSSPKLS